MLRTSVILFAVATIVVLLGAVSMLSRNPALAPFLGLQQSGVAFPMGISTVNASFGYYGNGDRLAFAIIRVFPPGATEAAMLNDGFVDYNSGGVPLVRHDDGSMKHVSLDGMAYLIDADGVLTYRIEMNEHTDTVGLTKCTTKAELEAYIQKFSP
jgi:hypothetical protein